MPIDTYTIYKVHPKDDGNHLHTVAGRFAIHGQQIHVMEDHFGMVKDIIGAGVLTPEVQKRMQSLARSAYYRLVRDSDVQAGHHPDLVPEEDLGEAPMQPEQPEQAEESARPTPPSVWDYHRVGLSSSQVIEFVGGKALMNGQTLTPEELKKIHENCQRGAATLTYRQ